MMVLLLLLFLVLLINEAGEVLSAATPFLERKIHPIVIISAFKQALEDSLVFLKEIAAPVDISKKEEMMKLIQSSIGTKMVSQWGSLMCTLAYEATKAITVEKNGKKEIDIKRYARVEKIPGGLVEDSCVFNNEIGSMIHEKL